MNKNEPLLKIRFDGASIGPGRIPVAHLIKFLSNMNKAFQRTGRILLGETESIHRGRQPRNVSEEVALELVLLTPGSPATILGFERLQGQMVLPGMELGCEIIEKALSSLRQIQEAGDVLPEGCDAGVLLAWRDVGVLFQKGVSSMQFTLNQRETPVVIPFTPQGFERIQERIKGPLSNIRTIEGRLLMADFKEYGTRCRVHPSIGEPVLCLFNEEQKEEVLENILHYVKIVGEAKEDPVTGKITSIKIHDIDRLEDRENEAVDLLPKGTPIVQHFWESPTLDELAQFQNVQPVEDIRALFGTWPGGENDGFEADVDELRHQSIEEECYE